MIMKNLNLKFVYILNTITFSIGNHGQSAYFNKYKELRYYKRSTKISA